MNKGLKLIVMVPCFNEEKTLPLVINSIPKKIPGIAKIETLIVDDGSSDKTVDIAKKLKVNHIVRHFGNKGLAQAFATGLETALAKGADIIVNTDGDNQYPQQDIPRLIKPILKRKAEIVVADRQTDKIKHFSPLKKFLQKFGSWTVRVLSGTDVPDAVSGFRAYSREAAMQLNVFTEFSYTIETIIQAGKKRIAITSIPIKVNSKTRESRLFRGTWSHVKRSGATTVRVFATYEPLKVFSYIGGTLFIVGFIIGGRYAFLYTTKAPGDHTQSLLLATLLMIIGFQIFLIGLVADLIAANRKLQEKSLFYLRNKHLTK